LKDRAFRKDVREIFDEPSRDFRTAGVAELCIFQLIVNRDFPDD
jgi:hypothetical protein